MPQQYAEARKARKEQPQPKENNSIQVEGALDLSEDKFPKIPAKPSPQLPIDDAFSKYRTSQS